MSDGALHGVLVTYRRPQHLDLMLERLQNQSRRLDTLLVVDNDHDGSARSIVERHSFVGTATQYLALGTNLGPAGGLAAGMEYVMATATNDDWLVLLDDDDPPRGKDMFAALEALAKQLRKESPTVAAVGACGSRFDPARVNLTRPDDDELAGAVPVDCIGGNQLPFYSAHAVRSVGVFDERIFFGFEELEFGLRLRSAGFRIYAHGEMWHKSRDLDGRLGLDLVPDRRLTEATWRRYYSLRNLIYILRGRGHQLAAIRLATRGIAKPLYNSYRDPRLAWQNLLLNMRAIADAYTGRMGRTVEPVR